MIRGSCLCGKVRYEVGGELSAMVNCHCSMCRKHHGAAFATFIRCSFQSFRFTSGGDLVQRYRSSEHVQRGFCQVCGSSLIFQYEPQPTSLWILAGTLDDDPGLRPEQHIFTASKAPWHTITDSLQQHEQLPD